MARGSDGSAVGRMQPMSSQQIRRRAIVHGHVQGVFFRDATREQAREHGVSGWVRNSPDGTVEAVLEGPHDAVQRMLQFLETGPPRARVERVEVHFEESDGLSGFAVY
jgi:acylphosphatase